MIALGIPARPEWTVTRTRLLDRLTRGARGPLTVVTGPPGAGKTVLAAAWAASGQPPGPVAWASLDGVRDADAFWARVRRGDLEAARTDPLVLVLDDVQGLGEAAVPALHAVIEASGPSLRVLLLSRQEPPVPLHRHRMSGALTEVHPGDLEFTDREAHVLLAAQGIHLSGPTVRTLRERTEGWAAGLRLAAMTMTGSGDPGPTGGSGPAGGPGPAGRSRPTGGPGLPSDPSGSADPSGPGGPGDPGDPGGPGDAGVPDGPGLRGGAGDAGLEDVAREFGGDDPGVVAHLVAEVLDPQPPELRRLMLALSVAERFDAALARALTGTDHDWAFPALVRRCAFVRPLGHGWYRYHRMLRDALRLTLRHEHPSEPPGLHRRAAAWCGRNGMPAEAVRHAVLSGDWRYASWLLVDGLAIGPVLGLADGAPPDDVLADLGANAAGDGTEPEPALVAAAVAAARGDDAACADHLRRADALLAALPGEPPPAARLAAGLVRLSRPSPPPDLCALVTELDDLLGRLPRGPLGDHPEIPALIRYGHGIAHLRAGRLADAAESLHAALPGLDAGGAVPRRRCLGALALTEALRGRFGQASRWSARAARIPDTPARPVAAAHLAQAWTALMEYHPATARPCLDAARHALTTAPDPFLSALHALITTRTDTVAPRRTSAPPIPARTDRASGAADPAVPARTDRLSAIPGLAAPGRTGRASGVADPAASREGAALARPGRASATPGSVPAARTGEASAVPGPVGARPPGVAALDAARAYGDPPDWLERRLLLAAAEAYTAAGDPVAALDAIRAAGDVTPEGRVALARAQIALGDPRAAGTLRPVLVESAPLPADVRVEAWLLDARLAYAGDDPLRGRRSLARALRLGERETVRLPFAAARAWLPPVLRQDAELYGPHRRFLDGIGPPDACPDAPDAARHGDLSARELEVLRLLSGMRTSEEIAAEMYVSVNTVKTHLRSIYRKLAVTRRGEAVRRARHLELL